MYYKLISFSLFLTSATGFVLSGIRISDVAFAATILLSLSHLVKKTFTFTSNPRIFYFFLVLLISILFSTVLNISTLISGDSNDYINLPIAVFGALLIFYSHSEFAFKKILINYSQITILVAIVLYFLFTTNTYNLELDLLLESDVRFSGLSKNPNQLALYLLPIPFFALHFYNKSDISFFTMLWMISGAFFVNFLVIGKALFVSWAIGLILIYILTGLTLFKKTIDYKNIYIRLFMVLFFTPLFSALIENLYTGDSRGGQEGQGEIRLLLWGNGLRAGFDSFFFGHGPGHYSGIFQPYEQMEAHNFYIDWFSAYGLLGLFCLFFLLSNTFIAIVKNRNIVMLGLLCAIMFQLFFHFYGRQPFFWIIVISILKFGSTNSRGHK